MQDYEIREKTKLNEVFLRCGDIKMSVIYGYLENDNGSYRGGGKHMHSTYEMHIVMNGSIEININDSSYILTQNDVIIIPPGTRHCLSMLPNVNFVDMTVMFSIKRRIGEHIKMYDSVNYGLKKISDAAMFFSPEIACNAAEIRKLWLSPNEFHTMNINCLMQSIALYIFDVVNSKNDKAMSEFIDDKTHLPKDLYLVKRIDEYISDYTKSISVNGLADYIDVSKRSAQRVFKRIYGMNFTEKITELRMSKAVELISTTAMTLEDISSEVGYLTYSTFRKAFVNYFGVSPNYYKKSKKNI